ncbi:hypothetical protein [Herbiconiux sp. VKM Ac-2851]|uniref:hypothetical protein n=1 Tax=Herbiconiux sp. VKM Ac-2851 TaxID=2739025 RepID=UPI00156441EA|nr:hypothetical protein [Herbiconiux sp. VKM Ac-2851]NQX35476.1 hypothetical protein [Herbiconiux sp. VKM Ac-2851]
MSADDMTSAERRAFDDAEAEAYRIAMDVTRIATNPEYEDLRHEMLTQLLSKEFGRAKALHRTGEENLQIATMVVQHLGLTIEVLTDELAAAREGRGD